MTRKGRNPLMPRLRRGMDIRHMTLAQYRYFRDVGLGGQLPNSQASARFRGRAPIRNRAAADLALCTGMRPEEWSTVLLPELRVGRRRPGESVEFAVQACAKYGKYREIYVPSGAVDALENFLLIERPELVAASANSLARRRRELFVVDHIDHENGKLRGVVDGQRRTFTMSAMGPDLRRITVQENENGVESLAVFVGCGGQMLGPSSWYRIRCDAWERMRAHAAHPAAPLMPRRRWRWHDTSPAGAVCLENAVVPEGHKGPLHDRCRPDRCANSVIGPEHVPIWASERRTLLTLIDAPGLSTCRRETLQRELSAVDAVLDKTDTDKEQA
jgi:hypothetical protein